MSNKKRVLFVVQEMSPYTALSEIAEIARKIPQYTQQKGMEIRVLMPRFGVVNERRHRLHEVVRLSGMNIIVNDDDYPLIIKVATLPGARIQVYFLDNEDFFRRKSVFEDDYGKPFEDNAERMIFFCKGVIEIVKKFGWAPDIVHCMGWVTGLVPLYLKTAYQHDPLFRNSKIVYSVYDDAGYDRYIKEDLPAKAAINAMSEEDVAPYMEKGHVWMHKGAVTFSDAIIQGSENLGEDVSELLLNSDKPLLGYVSEAEAAPAYLDFYNSLIEEKVQK